MTSAKPFRWKAFISLYIALSFVILALSGLVLYVAPPGRVANWSIWRLGLMSKAQWQAVHTIFSFLFIVAGSFHLYYNWKVLTAYLRTKLDEGRRMKRELTSAVATGAVVLGLTIGGVPPFSLVMDAGDELKNAWTAPSKEPPIPHAEELTVDKLAETAKVPVVQARANLEKRGVVVERADMTVKQIAEANRLTPEQVYQRMYADGQQPAAPAGLGGGWGRRTVNDICTQFGVPTSTGLQRLQAAGYAAESATPLKDLATGTGRTPAEIAQVIVGPDATITTPETHKVAPPPTR